MHRIKLLSLIAPTSQHHNYQVYQKASFHSTAILNTKSAGRHKRTIRQDKPLTYEQANQADQIGVRKGWHSYNTSNLLGGLRPAETSHEDVLIRRFIHGTWPRIVMSDVIIKRRSNQIILSFMALRSTSPSKMYFLLGYTEQILSQLLKCVVKVEIQTLPNRDDLTYKYI